MNEAELIKAQEEIIAELEKKLKLYKEACCRLSRISVDKDLKITELTADRNYWEREAKKWCDKLFEVRLLVEAASHGQHL